MFPYCSLKVHLPDLLDLLDDMVVINVNSAALTTVPIVAVPVAMILTLGVILINQQEGGWAFDEGESGMEGWMMDG